MAPICWGRLLENRWVNYELFYVLGVPCIAHVRGTRQLLMHCCVGWVRNQSVLSNSPQTGASAEWRGNMCRALQSIAEHWWGARLHVVYWGLKYDTGRMLLCERPKYL